MSGLGKKENNNKNFSSREAWMAKKKEGRPKQIWIGDYNLGWAKEKKGVINASPMKEDSK